MQNYTIQPKYSDTLLMDTTFMLGLSTNQRLIFLGGEGFFLVSFSACAYRLLTLILDHGLKGGYPLDTSMSS
jgi:hypothetical protein